ncbi:TIGR01457 family HAD-type hydrolase [Bacillaceae bacterium SIJ1]|uniref:TIGR01457 family HAD-type hydrolase n=1 Tax=Litoribacterium kuwaitense TaxID=1398745 RepID=UPI0013EA7E1A|nr:TIGR01457 family HAD-type hydrolase [Litoribacterium kuwaitense]NGP46168.1 TIGR01457 family HAD-type hydrolase [Litoribacterium kuwaitense]
MKTYEGFLIDLDGTMYRGKDEIKEATQFVQQLKANGQPYLFVTNNSTKRPEEVAEKLASFGVPAGPEHIVTTSMATAQYMKERNQGKRVYFIGQAGLEHALTSEGFEVTEASPDYVVVGLDPEVTYEKLAIACLAVRKGAFFISTNSDRALVTERGFLPGNGAITSVVEVSTGQQPVYIGKPEAIIMEQAISRMGLPKDKVLMIGDNYDTDIVAGIRAGVDTLLVHTGVTTAEHLKSVEVMPTWTATSLANINI